MEEQERPMKISKIDPTKFYSTDVRWEERLQKIRTPLSPQKPDIPKVAVWMEFPKQLLALEYMKENKGLLSIQPLVLFSFEVESKLTLEITQQQSTRKYLVTTYEDFWKKYSIMEDKDKHYYEVVIDEHHCHLYLDVEFYYEFNPNLLSKETIILELLKDMICLAISDKYSITITSKDILDLDSSTATKFSCHLIIRIPNSCFINNINCGNFVKYLILQIETYLKHDSNLELLFVHNDKNKRVFIADLAVYSKNRNFRVFKSSKYGKEAVLTLSDRNQCRYDNNDKDVFLASMICNTFGYTQNVLLCDSPHTTVQSPTNVVSTQQQQQGTTGNTNSPFPHIDNFIRELVLPGSIRTWLYFSSTSIIIYNIIGNKYCENIQRQHKSNHIYFVVNLNQLTYVQKCYDPGMLIKFKKYLNRYLPTQKDCKNFHFQPKPIPIKYLEKVDNKSNVS